MLFTYKGPLRTLTITTVDNEITSIVFGEKQCHPCPSTRLRINSREALLAVDTNKSNETNLTKKIQKQLDGYFAGKLKVFDLPLQYKGTPFQMKVWNYLRTIPYGKTMSYQAVAKAIGHPKSTRAVGTACKRNPIPIIIPCHRVVKSNGEIGEYTGGRQRKVALLKLETGNYSDKSSNSFFSRSSGWDI